MVTSMVNQKNTRTIYVQEVVNNVEIAKELKVKCMSAGYNVKKIQRRSSYALTWMILEIKRHKGISKKKINVFLELGKHSSTFYY